jgi:hypothetical protein
MFRDDDYWKNTTIAYGPMRVDPPYKDDYIPRRIDPQLIFDFKLSIAIEAERRRITAILKNHIKDADLLSKILEEVNSGE